jgi:hypothetical protein
MLGSANVLVSPVGNGAPESMPTGPEPCGTVLPVLTFMPVTTVT